MPDATTTDATSGDQGDKGTKDGAPAPSEGDKLLASFKEAGIENPAGALDTIKKLREYEKGDKLPASVAKELEDLRAAAKAAEDAKLTDAQKAARKDAEAEQKVKDLEDRLGRVLVDNALTAAAARAKAVDAADVVALIDRGDLELDKNGQPTNADKLVKELKGAKPHLFGTAAAGSFDGGSRQSADQSKDMNALLRKAAGR